MKPLIYVAGPYTKGNCVLNVRRAVLAGIALAERGYTVYVPHCNMVWDLVCDTPKTYDFILEQDIALLVRCDAVVRLSGESYGSDQEVKVACAASIPVFFEDLGDLELL
jgi:hypothetical protein